MNDAANNDLSHAKPADDGKLKCGDCIYCEPGPDTQNDILSRCCYRMPPVPMLAPTPKGPGVVTVRPLIRVDTWACGEFDSGEVIES